MEKWNLPSDWEWKTLPEICQINPRRPRIQRSDDMPTSFVPMQAVDDVKGRIVDMQTRSFGEVKRGYTYFEEGDILFAKITPSMENGKAAIARDLVDGFGLGTTEFHVFRPSESIMPDWIFYYIRRHTFRMEAKARFRGAVGQQRVPEDFLSSYEIPVPCPDEPVRSLETQRRIVTRLETILAEVAEARQLQERIVVDTQQVLKAVLREVNEQLEQGHSKRKLGDQSLFQIVAGQHVLSKDYTDQPPGTPYITGPADFGGKYPEVTKWTTHPHAMSEPGDVLFTVKGSGVGKVNCAPVEHSTCISRQIMAIRPNLQEIDTEYLFYLLRGSFDEFQALRQGAAIPGIRKEQVEAIEIPLPTLPKQKEIVNYIEAVNEELLEMQKAQTENADLIAQLEQSFLAQAFRGEL